MNNIDMTHEQLDTYNASISGLFAESWYYDMIEDLNALAVSGGEWGMCWQR